MAYKLRETPDRLELTARDIQMVSKHLKKRASIKGSGGPHHFRHYFATRYLEAGGDINSLRLLLGHATLDMVLRYSKYVDVRRALANRRRFNPLDRLYRGETVTVMMAGADEYTGGVVFALRNSITGIKFPLCHLGFKGLDKG